MSKRNSDGDVLSNRFSVFQADQQRLLASLIGSKTEAELSNETERAEKEDAYYKDEALGYEQLGIGGKIPKDIQDGSFTRRSATSNDKLLAQLIGSKAAKAHIASKQAPKNVAKPFRTTKPEESEDEEEGRAAAFKSKRRKTERRTVHSTLNEADGGAQDTPDSDAVGTEETLVPSAKKVQGEEDSEAEDEDSRARNRKPKPGSYLDEILEERSRKKKKKNKRKTET